jgi:hypothetical protein
MEKKVTFFTRGQTAKHITLHALYYTWMCYKVQGDKVVWGNRALEGIYVLHLLYLISCGVAWPLKVASFIPEKVASSEGEY